jgi:hypothetical protein
MLYLGVGELQNIWYYILMRNYFKISLDNWTKSHEKSSKC